MITQDNITVAQRLAAPTPKFFRILRTIGITLAAVAGVIVAAPVALPAGLVAVAGYVATGAAVLAAVPNLAVDYKELALQQAIK